MSFRMKSLTVTVAGGLALALMGPGAAYAAPTDESHIVNESAGAASPEQLAGALETVFTEVVVLDESGRLVSYDEDRAVELLGEKEAAELTRQVEAARGLVAGPASRVAAASANSFVDCMVQNSVIGLISGVATGAYAELIREQKWDELAEKLLPRLVRSGFTGGVVGIVGSLAAGAVQCSFFNN